MILKSHKLSKIFMFLAYGILGIYCFIAFYPIPSGIGTGLDPSWQYALTRAAADKLIFGRDIIITYGPLGYLVGGAVWNQNFFSIFIFNFVVHIAIFGVVFAKILKLKTNLQKIAMFISLMLPFIINFSTDYKILFAFIFLLSSDNIFFLKKTNFYFLCLGAFSGFCLLTKFNLGVSTFVSLTLLILGNLYDSIKARVSIFNSLLHLLNVLLSATSVAFIFLNPNYLFSFNKILICLAVSSILGAATWFTQKVVERRNVPRVIEQFVRKTGLTRVLRWRFISWGVFYTAYFISLLITIFSTSPSLINYLKSSLEIASGYSSGMSLVGSPWELGFAISELILILILLTKIAAENSVGFSLCLAFVLWMTFKHGFVRQDLHVLIFIFSTPLIVSLCIAKSKNLRTLKFSFLIHTYVLAIALSYLLFSKPFGQQMPNFNISQTLNFANIVAKTSVLLDPQKISNTLDVNSLVNLNNVKLPPRVTTLLKDKEVDIVPWEISLVEANKLNWKPRPIFQSYSAYTSFLDLKNSESILKNPRDYILYQFLAIDGRHPFFDEPETFYNIFCNYRLSSNVPHFVNTPSTSNLMILEKRKSSICSSGTVEDTFSTSWNKFQSIEVSDGLLVRAAVNIQYSSLGKIYKTLFRSPPVMINVNYINGSTSSYRIIPENSNNGVIISTLPQNDNQAISLFQGQLYNNVKSISFSTSNPLLYKQNIDVVLKSYKVLETANKKKLELFDTSKLKSLRFLPAQPEKYMGVMDSKQESRNKYFNKGDLITASGWATLKLSKGEKSWVLLTYGSNNKLLAITETGVPRPDVANFFDKSEYTNSGWSITFSSDSIADGVYDIKAWIYEPSDNSARPLTGVYRVEIR